MGKPLIFDSTPLIYLTRVSAAKFFKVVPERKFTTASVFCEVVNEGKKKGAPEASLLEGLFTEKIINVRNPKEKEYLNSIKEMAAENERQPLHQAEAEVLCLAKELDGVVIADDKAAKRVAKLLGIDVHGTAYMLGKIYATRKIEKEELIEKVTEMRKVGWHVSSDDYFRIIEYLRSL